MNTQLIEKLQLTPTEDNWWKSAALPGLELFAVREEEDPRMVLVWSVIRIGARKWQLQCRVPIEVLLSDDGLVFLVNSMVPTGKDLLGLLT